MPGRIFSQLRLPTNITSIQQQQQQQQQHQHLDRAKTNTSVSVAEIPSMDHLHTHVKRPSIANIAKRHGSSERSKDKDRSASKDKNRSNSKEPRDVVGEAVVSRSSTPVSAAPAVRIGLVMESPPILMIGSPQTSTGALISGRVQLTPTRAEAIVEDMKMYLESTMTSKRPAHERCRECRTRVVDLYEWNFLSKPKFLSPQDGTHELPFSHLVPGHLPTTTHGSLASIDYSLHIRARLSDGTALEFRRELLIQRALVPGPDKNSVRIFPPTNLTLYITLPNIIHPIGSFPVQCRMTGIFARGPDTHTRWRLRKLSWRVEEHESAIAPACAKHSSASKTGSGTEAKEIQHESTREIGSAEMKQGWKTDFDGPGDGTVEGEFLASIDAATNPQTGIDASTTSSSNNLKISHHLILELVIAEEWTANKRPNQPTPTGAARVLRTQFLLNVTQRAGMGISWDDEMPPMYDDVPASPPRYLGEGATIVDGVAGGNAGEGSSAGAVAAAQAAATASGSGRVRVGVLEPVEEFSLEN